MGLLRFFLALSVAAWHVPGAPFHLLYAPVAVVCFFTISGFYMAMVLTERYDCARDFYLARFVRLYPAYFAMATVMVLWFWWTNSPTAFTGGAAFNGHQPVVWWESTIHVLLNIIVFGQDLFELIRVNPSLALHRVFPGDFFNSLWMLVGQAWSLSSEAFFYVMAPFIVRSPLRIIAGILGSLLTRVVLLSVIGLPWQWGYNFFPATFCFFLMGALAYHLHRQFNLSSGRQIGFTMGGGLALWLCWTILANGIALPAGHGASIDEPRFWIFYVIFAAGVPFIFEATKSLKADRWIGEISYPLYLVHGLVQGIIYFRLGAPQGSTHAMIIALSCSIAAAMLMLAVVEYPAEQFRHRMLLRRVKI